MTTAILIALIVGGGALGTWRYGEAKRNEGKMEAHRDIAVESSNISVKRDAELAEEINEVKNIRLKKQDKYRDTFKSKDGKKRAEAAFDLLNDKAAK